MSVLRKATLISFLVSIVILIAKFYAYTTTHSTALLSDALESIINVAAAGVTLLLMKYVALPADDNHPYGHGKLEYFSAAFEGGFIAFAGLLIGKEAILALWTGAPIHNLDSGLLIATIAAIMNLGLGLYLKGVATKEKSEALTASAAHILSDVWSTVGVLVGLGLVRLTGITVFDAIAALMVAGNLAYSGYRIFRRSAAGLVDEVHPETLEELARTFNSKRSPGIIDIHLTKVIRSGAFHHVDCHLVLPEFWSLCDAHPFVDGFEKDAIKHYAGNGEINFHIDPCLRRFCSQCEVTDCPVRQRPFERIMPFTAESLSGMARHD